MGWWSDAKVRGKGSSGPPVKVASSQPDLCDEAHDAIAAILRNVGETAFESEESPSEKVRETAEAWALHVLMVAPPPGQRSRKLESGRRLWSEVQRFIALQLRERATQFEKAATDLREVVQAFVHSVSTVVDETERSDEAIGLQLERLRNAAEERSVEKLRSEALLVAEQINSAVVQRQERQRTQLAALSARVKNLRSQLETARKQSEFDPLTELANRKAFDEYIGATVEWARLTAAPSSLLFVDADHFKSVNDIYGHVGGDKALKGLADCLVRTFPRRGDFVARYGGEEFCVILRNTEIESAEKLAQRLLAAVRKIKIQHDSKTFDVTVSVGVATLRSAETAEQWVKRADAALYRAKQDGRDRAYVDDSDQSLASKPNDSRQLVVQKATMPVEKPASEKKPNRQLGPTAKKSARLLSGPSFANPLSSKPFRASKTTKSFRILRQD